MRYLIIGRHGHYSREPKDGMGLSDRGKTEVLELIGAIRGHVHGTVKVVYCGQYRIEQSAEMFGEAFGVAPVMAEILESGTADQLYEEDAVEIVAYINSLGEDVDTLIVVNSLPPLRLLPRDFGKQVLGTEFPEIQFRRSENADAKESLPTGSAVVIDCLRKSLTLVRRDEHDEVLVEGIEPEAPASPPPKRKPKPEGQAALPGLDWE